MLLGILHASLLGELLTGRGIYRARKGKGVIATRQGWGKGINRAGEGIVRAGYGCSPFSALQNNSNSKMEF